MKILILLSMLMSVQAFANCPMVIKDIAKGTNQLEPKDTEKLRYRVRALMVKKGYSLVDDIAGLENASTLNYSLKLGIPTDLSSDGTASEGSRYEYDYRGLGQAVQKFRDDQIELGKKVKTLINRTLLERRTYSNFLGELKALPNCPLELQAANISSSGSSDQKGDEVESN